MSVFYYLLRTKRLGNKIRLGANADDINRASIAMLAYALVYTVLIVPLAYVPYSPFPHRPRR